MSYNGIDVSTWQGNIDWKKVESSGIDFAMIRASYGTSSVDNQFYNNMQNISGTNINAGTYHYCYALSVDEAEAEAKNFINTIRPYSFSYPVALDIEDSSIMSLGKSTITDIATRFCNVVQDAGYYVMIYSNLNWFSNYLALSQLSQFDIWLAQWAENHTFSGDLGMWQYSATGSVNGISGNVDLNISYNDYNSIIESKGLNKVNPNNNDNSEYTLYTVKDGDTLWDIAERFLGNGARYREIQTINNLDSDVIYQGEVLKIPQGSGIGNIGRIYTVKSGDTLWDIAEKFLGSGTRYREIKILNNLESDTIYEGQTLKIPQNSNIGDSVRMYTVEQGDTLSEISEKLLGDANRYTEIQSLNNLQSDVIYPGQILKIPS